MRRTTDSQQRDSRSPAALSLISLAAIALITLGLLAACTTPDTIDSTEGEDRAMPTTSVTDTQEIYLAGGCFWGLEAYFQQVRGIVDTEAGYANGVSDTADYRSLPTTGHAETVRVVYDPTVIHLAEILDRYMRVIDPLALNRQGNDVGTQYRTGIYYTDERSRQVGHDTLAAAEEQLGQEPVVELEPLRHFIPAEEEHQDYLAKNPGGYCHIDLRHADRILYPGQDMPSDEELRAELPALSYDVIRNAGTERPGTSEFNDFTTPGVYVDIATGQPLFSTDDQYDAGCGWPSFTKPITTDVILYAEDRSHGMDRTETLSEGGRNHLGHVFEDGPEEDGGLRYCINGAALRFIPYDQLSAEGLASLKPYVQER